MSNLFQTGRFMDFEDDLEMDYEDAMNLCCHICGEWLQWDAKVVYDSIEDKQYIEIESTSCGEKFRLHILSVKTELVENEDDGMVA